MMDVTAQWPVGPTDGADAAVGDAALNRYRSVGPDALVAAGTDDALFLA